jgi:hypothetical protein
LKHPGAPLYFQSKNPGQSVTPTPHLSQKKIPSTPKSKRASAKNNIFLNTNNRPLFAQKEKGILGSKIREEKISGVA